MTKPNHLCIEWSCSLCGVKGIVDPVNDAETAITGIDLTHKLLSPDCPNSRSATADDTATRIRATDSKAPRLPLVK